MDPRPSAPATTPAHASDGDTFVSGALSGLLPLGLLAGLVVLTLVLTTIARLVVGSHGFFLEQEVDLIVLVAGLGLAAIAYVVVTVRTVRRVTAWQRAGAQGRPNGSLFALLLTALVVVLPVLLALLVPQHPAP
jgi:hypothetical protein